MALGLKAARPQSPSKAPGWPLSKKGYCKKRDKDGKMSDYGGAAIPSETG